MPTTAFSRFSDFYPLYLSQHQSPGCRRAHFMGTTLVTYLLVMAVCAGHWHMLWWVPPAGYGFAWAGHALFEHNRPATFENPLYSLMGDFVMFRDMLLGRIEF